MKKRVTSRPVRPQIFISVDPTGPAPVCPSTLSRARDNRRRGPTLLCIHGSRYARRESPSRESAWYLAAKKGYTPQPGSCASRGSPTTAAPDGSRCSRLHASFTLPFLRPIHASPPLAHLAGISVPDETRSARRKTRFPPLRGLTPTLRHFVHGPGPVCALNFSFAIRRDGWIRETVVLSRIYISFLFFLFFYVEGIFVRDVQMIWRWWWW